MPTQLIVLNGGSSSGKTALARRLQTVLPDPWLSVSVDTFVDALPPSLSESGDGITFSDAGEVLVGGEWNRLEEAWRTGLAVMARAGAGIIIDDVFLGGGDSQARAQKAFHGLDVLWVGVRCAGGVAAARERARGDRTAGMAALQADSVHSGVSYDLEVDTGEMELGRCAALIAARVKGLPAAPPPPSGAARIG